MRSATCEIFQFFASNYLKGKQSIVISKKKVKELKMVSFKQFLNAKKLAYSYQVSCLGELLR